MILAAGLSLRMEGAHKLLLPYGGTTIVGAVARAAREAGLDPVLVVLGHRALEVREALEGSGAEPLEHPGYAEGSGSSLAAGIAAVAARPGVAAAVVLLGDEPGVRPATIRAVVGAWREGRGPSLRARYRDRPGHPVLFDRSLFPGLRAAGGVGRSGPVARPGDSAAEVAIPADAPVDVDTRADHARALARLGE